MLKKQERGSALVGSIFGIAFLSVLTLGVVEVAVALYARNAVASAVHEGARAALELHRGEADAHSVARAAVLRAAGGLIDDLELSARVTTGEDGVADSRVTAVARIRLLGPIPFSLPVELVGRASGQRIVP